MRRITRTKNPAIVVARIRMAAVVGLVLLMSMLITTISAYAPAPRTIPGNRHRLPRPPNHNHSNNWNTPRNFLDTPTTKTSCPPGRSSSRGVRLSAGIPLGVEINPFTIGVAALVSSALLGGNNGGSSTASKAIRSRRTTVAGAKKSLPPHPASLKTWKLLGLISVRPYGAGPLAVLHFVLWTVVFGTFVSPAFAAPWYRKLKLPDWGITQLGHTLVRTLISVTLGMSLSRVVAALPASVTSVWSDTTVVLWAAHFALHLLQYAVSYGAQLFKLGLAMYGALLATLVGVVLPRFWAANRAAGLLLLPYAGWLLYQTVLYFVICRDNP